MKRVINVFFFAMVVGFITLWAVMATDNPIWFIPVVLFGATLWHLLEVKSKQ